MKTANTLLIGIILALSWSPSFAATNHWILDVDPAQSQVDFHAIGHPNAIKIHGTGSGIQGSLQGKDNKSSGQLKLSLETLDTGIKMRNEHMKKKYLETDKYPDATLTLQSIDLPSSFPLGNVTLQGIPFKGQLTLHGTTKPIEGKTDIKKTGADVHAEAHFSTKVSDYGIASPGFAGVTMADQVDVDVTLNGKIR